MQREPKMVSYKRGGRRSQMINPVKLVTPGENDILCGKDRACALHPGSQRFRAVIDSYRARYLACDSKYSKMMITKEIYETLNQTSKFLKFNEKEQLWEEITPLAGRDKIGHALRFANNHSSNAKKKKPAKKAPAGKRHPSFSSGSSVGSGSSSSVPAAAPPPETKAELVATLVEKAKEEPKIWNKLVDHCLTLEEALTTVPPGEEPAISHAAAGPAHRRDVSMLSIADPVALENIAYAVDSNTNDTALDELIDFLNNEDVVTEEDLQDVLGMNDDHPHHQAAGAPAVASSGSDVQQHDNYHHHLHHESPQYDPHHANIPAGIPLDVAYEPDHHYDTQDIQSSAEVARKAGRHIRRTSSCPRMLQHKRGYSVDDDMWSVMQEPLLDADDWH